MWKRIPSIDLTPLAIRAVQTYQMKMPGILVPGFGADNNYGVTLTGFLDQDQAAVMTGVKAVGNKLYSLMCTYFTCRQNSPGELFHDLYGDFTFSYYTNLPNVGKICENRPGFNNILCNNNSGTIVPGLIAHELGHAFNVAVKNHGYGNPEGDLANSTITYKDIVNGDDIWVTGKHWVTKEDGSKCFEWERGFEGYLGTGPNNVYHGQTWDDYKYNVDEEFADMFANWVMDGIPSVMGASNPNGFTTAQAGAGDARRVWMDEHIFHYLYPLAVTGNKFH